MDQEIISAVHCPRITALNPTKSKPLMFSEFRAAKRSAPVLAVLSWWLAARVGDARQLDPNNIVLEWPADQHGFVGITATFTRGKGAHFWGPYTVHSRLPAADAKLVADRITALQASRGSSPHLDICTPAEQRAFASTVASFLDCSLRSVRRDALLFYATAGATDHQLQLLSGHKRRDTLLRYLGWGRSSAEARAAAHSRTALVAPALATEQVVGSGDPAPMLLFDIRRQSSPPVGGVSRPRHPTYMGPFSGFTGIHGRRVLSSPELFPRKAPSGSDLGLAVPDDGVRTADWGFHVKFDVHPLPLDDAPQHVQSADLRQALVDAIGYIHDSSRLGATWAPFSADQVPRSSFTAAQWRTMVLGKKALPARRSPDGLHLVPVSVSVNDAHDTPTITGELPPIEIRSVVKGFPTAQPAKKRDRPVFETMFNSSTDRRWFPPLSYASRSQRRHRNNSFKYRLQFDYSAWYDQAALDCSTLDHFVCRGPPTEIDGEVFEYFVLLRVPMGASFSAHVMQTLTWAIIEPLILRMIAHDDGQVHLRSNVATMIENVLIEANDPQVFVELVTMFYERNRLFGAQLNDVDSLPVLPDDIIRAGDASRSALTFCGEQFTADGSVCNTDKNVTNLETAFQRLQRSFADPSAIVTRRQLAAFIGLACWMASTVDVSVRDHFEVLRLFSANAQAAAASGWDVPASISAASLDHLGRFSGPLITNTPVKPLSFAVSSVFDVQEYDAVLDVLGYDVEGRKTEEK